MRERLKRIITAGIWVGAGFGLIEGILLTASRGFPVVLASHKASAHLLWVAPTIDIVIFVTAGVLLTLVIHPFAVRMRRDSWRLVLPVLVAGGCFAVLDSLDLMDVIAAALLSTGIAVTLRPRLERAASRLEAHPSWLLLVPALLVSLVTGVSALNWGAERIAAGALPAAAERAWNVLVIVLDTVRRDSFDNRMTDSTFTPNIDRLMRRGTWFDNAWATSSWSLPSQATLLTGLDPDEHGARWPHLRLKRDEPTLPQLFSRHGYVTGAFSGNSAWITPEYVGRGFLRFRVYNLENAFRRTTYGRRLSWFLNILGYSPAGRGRDATAINRDLLGFVDRYPRKPFFAYLCYMDVNQTFHHELLNRPVWSQRASIGDVYGAYEHGLRKLDGHIGRLLQALEQRHLLENTLIVVTSDHGESFGPSISHDHELMGHGTSLYAEQTRVPLLMVFPPPGRRPEIVTRQTSLQSVPAMITEAMGWPDDPLVAKAMPPGDAARSTLYYGDRQVEAATWHDLRLYRNLERDSTEQLFDLATDPFETRNLIRTHPVPDSLYRLLNRPVVDY